MQITTTARHCRLDAEDKVFVEERVGRLARYARDLREAHVILTAEGYRYRAEITLHLNHRELVGHEESPEPRRALDLAADHLEEQLRRLKEKRVDSKRGPRLQDGAAAAAGEDTAEGGEE